MIIELHQRITYILNKWNTYVVTYINTVLNLSYAHTKHICRNTESKNQTMEAVLSSSSSSTLVWPGGFVFDPLDEVLVVHYLHPKATEISYCKCHEVIPERDLYGTEEPWQIWEKMERANNCIRNKEEMFFFTRLKRVSSKSNRCKRSIGKGCWKGDGNSSNIFYCADQNERKRIGVKKTYHYEKNNVKTEKSKSNDEDNKQPLSLDIAWD